MAGFEQYIDPRNTFTPALVAFLLGLLLHAIDQTIAFRAGPIPILLTAPTVGILVYLRLRPATGIRRAAALLVWGIVGSGLGVLGVYLLTANYQLPRSPTGPEMVGVDLVMFLWFVAALTAVYASATRFEGFRETPALLAAPLLQAAFVPVFVTFVELGLYA